MFAHCACKGLVSGVPSATAHAHRVPACSLHVQTRYLESDGVSPGHITLPIAQARGGWMDAVHYLGDCSTAAATVALLVRQSL